MCHHCGDVDRGDRHVTARQYLDTFESRLTLVVQIGVYLDSHTFSQRNL